MISNNRHIIASIFLILFSFMQLADLHVVSHDVNDVDCELCLIASENLEDNFIPVNSIEIPKEVIVPVDHIQITYTKVNYGINTHYSFLNKAPPVA
ncbi:hypothetical protein [Aquimarina sp. SS2-1]|uniref:hypothetical protein n=1 Tax=Aquimarina besae TaxID=3342247 RepID=UPI0036729097